MGYSSEARPDAWRPSASTENLRARGQALADVRAFFADRQVLEVQTPLLGRASVTDPAIQAFALEGGFLQTSTEYHQKRLLAAGVGDNYTLGSVFRAGEQGRIHGPEFTMLEWYRVGIDDRELMGEVAQLVDLLLGPDEYHTHSYSQLLAGVSLSPDERQAVPPADHEDLRLARAIDALGAGRYFVTDYPAEAAVLARLDSKDPSIARRFELVVSGVEIANGYFELTDADVHRARFAQDNRVRAERALKPVEIDTALLAAIDSGLPRCAGVAVGFDRLLMLSLNADSLAEVQAFGWDCR